jgi:hypothetical protein
MQVFQGNLSIYLASSLFYFSIACTAIANEEGRIKESQNEASSNEYKNPETWESTLADCQMKLDQLTEAAMAAAKNKTLPNKSRQNAVMFLGKLGNQKAIDFLVDNIDPMLSRWDAVFVMLDRCTSSKMPSTGNPVATCLRQSIPALLCVVFR